MIERRWLTMAVGALLVATGCASSTRPAVPATVGQPATTGPGGGAMFCTDLREVAGLEADLLTGNGATPRLAPAELAAVRRAMIAAEYAAPASLDPSLETEFNAMSGALDALPAADDDPHRLPSATRTDLRLPQVRTAEQLVLAYETAHCPAGTASSPAWVQGAG